MLIVNIFGAPGAGKSTYAARLYSELKVLGVETELVREVAKQYVYDGTLCNRDQHSLLTKAIDQIEGLCNQVEVVVSDSPVLLSAVYATSGVEEITRRAASYHYSRPSLNYMMALGTDEEYSTRGRIHSHSEALKIEDKIIRTIRDEIVGTFYCSWGLEKAIEHVKNMAEEIETVLNWDNLYSRASR